MKYVIEIEDTPYGNLERDLKLYKCNQFNSLVFDEEGLSKLTPYTEPDRNVIEDEVWEFASMLMNMHPDVAEDIYWSMNGGKGIGVAAEMTYQEAKAKYDSWIKANRDKEKRIEVGDEIEYKDCPSETAIVLRLYQPTFFKPLADLIYRDGKIETQVIVDKLVKTGRHFPQVEEMLKAMKGE